MSHFLDINQLAEEAGAQGLDEIVTMLEQAAQKAAEAIAAKRGDVMIVDDASSEPGFGGLCVGFGPVNVGDACPEDFAGYDESSSWADPEDESFTCTACGREEGECSANPCAAVIADREA